jgi:hypothetical protein
MYTYHVAASAFSSKEKLAAPESSDDMSDERHNADFIANIASNVLSQQLRQTISLHNGKVFITAASIVVRCHVLDNRSMFRRPLLLRKLERMNLDGTRTAGKLRIPLTGYLMIGQHLNSSMVFRVPFRSARYFTVEIKNMA